MNKGKKLLAVLSATAMVATLAPMAPAFASSEYSVPSGVQSYQAGTTAPSIRVAVKVDGGSFTSGTAQSVVLRLPANTYAQSVSIDPASGVPANIEGGTANNAITSGTITNPTTVDPNNAGYFNEFTLNVTPNAANIANDGLIYLDLKNVELPSGSNGTVTLTFDAQQGSPFTSGDVTVAQVGSGNVDVSIDNTVSIPDSTNVAIGTIRVKENQAGALSGTGKALKIKLPSGFTWVTPPTATKVWGDSAVVPQAADVVVDTSDNRTVTIYNDNRQASTSATYYTLTGGVIAVDDTVAKTGDVVAQLSGDSTLNESSLTLGAYGDYSTAVTVANPATVQAGADDASINDGSIKIVESLPQSLVANRTIKLTLSGNAQWDQGDLPYLDTANSDLEGLQISQFAPSVNDPQTITATINKASSANATKGATLVFKSGGIDVAGDQGNSDVTVNVAGTAGVTGSGTLAHIQVPVTTTVEGSLPNLKIGVQNQTLGNIDLTEALAGAIDNKAGNNQVSLTFPVGVTLNGTPTIKVTNGDLVLQDASYINKTTNADGSTSLNFTVKSTSSTPSTIQVSGLNVNVDRTVPEGDFKVKVGGSAIVESGFKANEFPNTKTLGSTTVANVITPAPGETTGSAVFTIGSTSYTVNGQSETAVIAPFIKDSRTFVGIRDAATALGVSSNDIIWNSADRSVTILNGNRAVRLVIGSNVMTLNGTPVTMDTAPTIVNGYTVLPLAWVGQALGVNASWDAANQQVTFGN